ncbi:hypothetical protein IV203_030247 [Nitzschia inconspicua]|uniref:DUF6824 domain-containing protein n=1 Tax=Nitzschia inconspicua TaxID=303405 RepID=A0A9K3LVQ1_9STRA|nr:hypothetical protein IV203_030247 [Nitzschia inconspicua]
MESNQCGEEEEIPTTTTDVGKMPPRMMSVDDSVMLPENYNPTDDDVICSWARQNHSHRNERFRMLIEKYAPIYDELSTKYQKSGIIGKIVNEVRRKSPGAGFVRKDFYSGRWFEIGNEKARDKVGHAIRKASAFLGEKQAAAKKSPTKKVWRSTKKKHKTKKNKHCTVLESTPSSQGGIVGETPPILLHDSSVMNRDFGQDNNKNLRAHGTVATLLTTPSLDPPVFPMASSYASSNMASFPSTSSGHGLGIIGSLIGYSGATPTHMAAIRLGLDNITTSDSYRLLQTIQARQFLSNMTQQQQHQLQQQQQQLQLQQLQQQQAMNIWRQSNETSLTTRNERDFVRGRASSSVESRLGMSPQSTSTLRLGLFPPAALLQQALQRGSVESLPTPSAKLPTGSFVHSGSSEDRRKSEDQEPRSRSQGSSKKHPSRFTF